MALMSTRAGYKASTILASQTVMRALIMYADGNVTIQTKNYPHPMDPDGVTDTVRLYCEKCQASKMFEFDSMFNETRLIEELEWAKAHKHSDGIVHIVQQDETPTVGSGDRKLKVIQ
jgi:hypothetical protein